MSNVILPRKQFEKEIGKLDEKMQNKIAMFGTPLSKFDNNEIEIEVFPNRPDLLSYHGFKRSFLAFLGKKTGLKEYKINKPEKDFSVIVDSSVKDVRPYTVCSIVKGLKFDDEKIKEIVEIQERLHFTIGRKRKKLAIGIYPLEKIKLPITFMALEPDKIKFIPLESDREMSGLQILQKHPTGREYAHLLAGKTKFPIFIDSNNHILSMPPIINSQETGKVTEETRDVFIECSGFDFDAISKCLNIIVTNLAEMGGEIYQMDLVYKDKKILTPNLSPEKVKINLKNAISLLGIELSEKEVKKFLEEMGHNYKNGIAEVPPWRTDIMHEVDLIEDVAIAYGYENFIPEIPEITTIGKGSDRERIKKKIAESLAGLNLLEVSNYHLTTKVGQGKNMGNQDNNFFEVEESKTDYNILRKDLSHYLLKVLSENVDSEYPQRIFELGKVFNKEAIGTDLTETENLALAVTPGNFTEVRQILEYLSRMINVKLDISEADKTPTHFIEGRTIAIKLDGKIIGYLGEIHPKILRNWKIKMPVSLFEINLEEIFKKLE